LFSGSSIVTYILLFLDTAFSRFCGVSIATIFPLFIIITLLHIWLTSDNICELRITVCVFPSFFINSLISVICFGSNPTVGSSKINILGFPTKAPAILTLCLYPLDKFFINFFSTSFSPVSSIVFSICSFLIFLSTFFI